MIRATHGVHHGSYYWEAVILAPEPIADAEAKKVGDSSQEEEEEVEDGEERNQEKDSAELDTAVYEPHVRIGWSTRQGELQGPVGYDKFSYAIRDVNGACLHKSARNDSYSESFGVGDIIGCFLHIEHSNPELNQMRFFRNGRDLGIAYSGVDIPLGVYFPAVSLYMKVAYASLPLSFFLSFLTCFAFNFLDILLPLLRWPRLRLQ